ncbi:acetyl-CoA carboxylase biotin carboxyl carrier protein subunit [Zunongwangia pacifica]|uniref:Acetyl-CoA carboxylase biotin carboxyl carrier protein subunit n=1 Tax=Zunongwangia pacifica TaxID=2911062 RepID=A0A9X1ZT56_9FLAO|nr:acetyl-CoA carboxylase biotin carboxyl carrier protein subunit [Zunongwangia pacifica]MCL6217238.1 acetyl-CoA carboxylase biotin carboxyl carrier protein subunit [Zunongwangia pacifica]
MGKKFKVKVNGTSEFEFAEDQIMDLDIQINKNSGFHILHRHKSFKASVEKSDFLKRRYSVKINSNIYTIDIENDLDLLIEKMGLSLSVAQLINDIKAPMPGLILEVNVEEGSQVKEGDYLLVLEAMKMENTITAPRDGVVKSIQIKKGETVDKNQLLIEME